MKQTLFFSAKCHALFIAMILLTFPLSAQISIQGKVYEKTTETPLIGAHILTEENGPSALSSHDGTFRVDGLAAGRHRIRVSFMGFKTRHMDILLTRDTVLDFGMEKSIILGDEVNIIATRAQSQQPATYSTITGDEIGSINLGKDLPFLIQTEPSTVVTSDAGNGIGYTGINIRGTDLTRINVTINGIPVNDAESQGVWFVDIPDLASSTEDIQIQRGVGTSTNGAGAFGATINMKTSTLNKEPYGELDLSGGSYNTFKSTLRFGTGLMGDKIAVDGRLSFIRSDGYIDRASSNLKSYFLSAGYFGSKTTLRIITFSGFEKTYQSWEGVPKDSLGTNRTYNPSGEYIDKEGKIAYYDNQTDNYQMDNYQLIFSQVLMKNWNINIALHYTKGKGYYENYEQNAIFSDFGLDNVIIGNDTIKETDLVNRKMMDNDFYGVTFSTISNPTEKLKITVGGAWNHYFGRHFGKIIWAEYASNGNNELNWYYNTGLKKDFNIYSKISYRIIDQLILYADLQYRNVTYALSGTLDDLRIIGQDHQFNFFNPKAGIFCPFSKMHQAYFSFGISNREPSRNNYKDADPDNLPAFETLVDWELGYHFEIPDFQANINFYYMNYKNQLVLTGEINNVGEAIMVNVPHSHRLGMEISAGISLFKKLYWDINATFSMNKIKDFTSYVDNYDSTGNFTGQIQEYLGTTDLSFSPGIVASSLLTYRPVTGLSVSLISKVVGRQYIDNTSNKERSLNAYFVNGLSVGYTIKAKPFREIGFRLLINNLFNCRYESNAWVYQYYYNHQHFEESGYFPQALINFLIGVTIKI